MIKCLYLFSNLRLVDTKMIFVTQVTILFLEYYFYSYKISGSGGLSLAKFANDFQEQFHKPPLNNALMLAVVEKFHLSCVLIQRKG